MGCWIMADLEAHTHKAPQVWRIPREEEVNSGGLHSIAEGWQDCWESSGVLGGRSTKSRSSWSPGVKDPSVSSPQCLGRDSAEKRRGNQNKFTTNPS